MGKGGWSNRDDRPSGYEPGKVYYRCVEELMPDMAGPDAPRWTIESFRVERETTHYVFVVRIGRARESSIIRMLKPFTVHPTEREAIDARLARLVRIADMARDKASRFDTMAADLRIWAAQKR